MCTSDQQPHKPVIELTYSEDRTHVTVRDWSRDDGMTHILYSGPTSDYLTRLVDQKYDRHDVIATEQQAPTTTTYDRVGANDPDRTYKHDCPDCQYLGWTTFHGEVYDLYVCPKDDGNLIARYGNDGRDYTSGLWFAALALTGTTPQADKTHPLAIALTRAIIRAATH